MIDLLKPAFFALIFMFLIIPVISWVVVRLKPSSMTFFASYKVTDHIVFYSLFVSVLTVLNYCVLQDGLIKTVMLGVSIILTYIIMFLFYSAHFARKQINK